MRIQFKFLPTFYLTWHGLYEFVDFDIVALVYHWLLEVLIFNKYIKMYLLSIFLRLDIVIIVSGYFISDLALFLFLRIWADLSG